MKLAALAVVAVLSAGSVTPAEAQFGKRLKERLKKNAEDKAIDKAVVKENEAIDAATTSPGDADTAAAAASNGAAAPAGVAESQKSIYDALSSTGRWATQGILFDTGKSEVKPESAPTLKQIAAAFKAHPELRAEIQGHTDNVGKADANLRLSQARAEAVKKVLADEYGVKADQLTAKGYGDTKPSADNKTAEGRANNRRVELVKS